MYDFIRFEVDNNTNSRDLDKCFPAEYPRFIKDEMLCWSECGCHWTISAPVAEEYQLREWLMNNGLHATKCEYIKRLPEHYHRDELVYGLREKKTIFDKYLSELEKTDGDKEFESGARFQLVYQDPDDIENLYNTHTWLINLYREASMILGLAIEELGKFPRPVKQASFAVSGFYANGGKQPKLLNLDGQPGKEIRLFDFEIMSNDYSWSCKLMAVRVDKDILVVKKETTVIELPSGTPNELSRNKLSGKRISTV